MVSLCIKLYTMNFRNIKQLKTSIRLFISYLLTSTGPPPPPGCAQQWRKALLNKHNISNTPDDHRHFALKHDKAARSITF